MSNGSRERFRVCGHAELRRLTVKQGGFAACPNGASKDHGGCVGSSLKPLKGYVRVRSLVKDDLLAGASRYAMVELLKEMKEKRRRDRFAIGTMICWSYWPTWEKVAASSSPLKFYWAQCDSWILDEEGLPERVLESDDGTEWQLQLVIPKKRVTEVLRHLHDNFSGGRLGLISYLFILYLWSTLKCVNCLFYTEEFFLYVLMLVSTSLYFKAA